MNSASTKGLSYTFFRYTYGPLSKEIYDDGAALHVSGLITSLKGSIKLTDFGEEFFASLAPLYEENQKVTKYIDSTARLYARLSFGTLKKKIYDLPIKWGGDTWKVGQIPHQTDMLTGLSENEAKIPFALDDDWIYSLTGGHSTTRKNSLRG